MRKTEIIKSSKELTKVERVAIKNLSSAVRLDMETKDGEHLIISPVYYVILKVSSEDKEYEKIIIEDKNGIKYTTGSETFISRFTDIYDEMEGEDFNIDIFSAESKKYTGKFYITCDLVA